MLLCLRQFFSGWFAHAECHDVTQPAETQDAFQRAVSGHIVSGWQEIKCRYQWNHGRNVLFIQNKTMLMRCFQCRVTMVDDLGGAAVIRCISKINIRNHTNHRRINKTAQSRAGGWTDSETCQEDAARPLAPLSSHLSRYVVDLRLFKGFWAFFFHQGEGQDLKV